MILTDYYKFERLAKKSKHRMDCTASTRSYQEFEQQRKTKAQQATEKRDAINVGDLFLYWCDPTGHMRADRKRKADRSITMGSNNLSSVFNWQRYGDNWLAFGDVKGTTDALLFVYHVEEADATILDGSTIEIFVARGKSNECNVLCNLYDDGALDDEVEALRALAAKSITPKEHS